MPPVAAVVFDLDGTLVDSRADIVASCQHALAVHGRPPAPEATIARAVGDGARALIMRVAGLASDDPALAPLLASYLEYYSAHGFARTSFLPGATEALAALAHLPLALATHKPRATTEKVLSRLALTETFAVVLTGDDIARHKPYPDPLLAIATALGLVPEQLVMVGDGPQDVLSGRAAGARTVAIPGCFIPRAELVAAEPDVLLESLFELPARVASWSGHATS